MTSCTSVYTVVSGEGRIAMLPRGWKADGTKPAVIAGHGHSSAASGPYINPPYGWYGFEPYLRLGFAVFQCDAGGGKTWNSDTALTNYENLRLWAISTYGAKTGAAHLLGFSMGACLAATYAADNPSKALSFVGLCPALNVPYLHDNNYGGFAAAELETAYGGSVPLYTAALPVKDPMARAAAGNLNLPTLIYHAAPDDTVITQASLTTYASNTGATVRKSATVTTHDPLVADPDGIATFINSI